MKPWLVLLLFAAALHPPAAAQEAALQDELDLQANANFVQGSGARAFGMGGAFLARPDDSTAASWNPAGLSYLKDPELSFVFLGSQFEGRREPVRECQPPDPAPLTPCGVETDERDSRYPDFAAVTLPWDRGSLGGAIQVSYQRVLPFQSSRTINLDPTIGLDGGPGDVLPRAEERTIQTRGGFDILALGAGARVSRKLRLGFSVNRWFNGIDQTRLRPELAVRSRQESDLHLGAWNLHLGAIFSPLDSLNLGFVFKTGFTAAATLARVRYDQYEAVIDPDGNEILPARTVFNIYSRNDVRIHLPSALGFGASWRPRSELTLSADYTRTQWSKGEIRNFFTLARVSRFGPLDNPLPDPPTSGDFCGTYGPNDRPPAPNVIPCPPVLPYPTLGADQQDTDQIRAGVEYLLAVGRLRVPLRAGVFRDSQFFPSLEGDPPTFTGFTLGTGLVRQNLLLDFAYVHESGTYTASRGIENQVGFDKLYASLIYRLPRKP